MLAFKRTRSGLKKNRQGALERLRALPDIEVVDSIHRPLDTASIERNQKSRKGWRVEEPNPPFSTFEIKWVLVVCRTIRSVRILETFV